METVIYHTQKALVFSSFYQFYQDFFFILKGIRKWSQKLIGFDLERMIYNLIFSIPAPCPGFKKVCFKYSLLCNLEFALNPINKIPRAGADIKVILRIRVNTIFEIFKYVILEVPVIFFGLDKLILANTVKAFEEILFPFVYPFPVIEILPKVYYKSLEKLSCFLVGINQKYKPEFFEENNINLDDKEYVIVNLSEKDPKCIFKKKRIERYGILLKDFDKRIEKDKKVEKISRKNANFSKHYLNKLMKKINNKLFTAKGGVKKELNERINEIDNDELRYDFFYFFISMFQNYKSYLKIDPSKFNQYYNSIENNTLEIDQIFKYEEFISKDMESIDFYSCFMNTKILKIFLINNLFPSTIEEKMKILLFDEHIQKKKNKNIVNQLFPQNTPFIDSDIFNIVKGKDEVIVIDSEEEKGINSLDSQIKNFPLLDNKKMEELFNKNYVEKEVTIKNLYIEFYTKCIQVLRDKKYLEGYSSIGYNINLTDKLSPNNEPFVLKLWILLICYSFKHLHKDEKLIVFYELLHEIQNNISPKSNLIEPFLADVIFSTFIKYGDKQMCSLLYKELSDCIYVKEDYIIFMKLHKKFMYNKDEFEKTFPRNTSLKERNYNIFNLPNNKKMEIVLISPHPECQRIDLKPVILTFKSQEEEELLFYCSICQKKKPAKITVSLGEERKEYQLYSAKYLFYFIKDLGDYNMQTFYKNYTEIFFNLVVLFQFRENFYEFLFPYKDWNGYEGFDRNFLYVKKAQKGKFIKKDKNKNKPNWYDVFEDEKIRQNKLAKLLPCKVGSVANFKTKEIVNSEVFFKKYNKKIVRNTMRLTQKRKIDN